jgi:hypothetical protein
LWTLVTVFVNFPDIPSLADTEASDVHSYIVTDLLFLFAYLFLVRHILLMNRLH